MALKTIYTGGIPPILLYRAQVWISDTDKVSYKSKQVRLKKHINIKIPKAYRTNSNETLCILTELTPIAIKREKACQFYEQTKGSSKLGALIDRDTEVTYWHHPAETINFLTENSEETSTVQIFTDGSKSEQATGAVVPIFRSGKDIKSPKYGLNKDAPIIKPSS